MVAIFHRLYTSVQDFFALAHSLDDIYMKHITDHNSHVMTAAAVLSMVIEFVMAVRLFVNHPAMDTPAVRVYLVFYLSLMGAAGLFLLIRPRAKGFKRRGYWLQLGFAAYYLLWNVLLNSYDLYRKGEGSSLAVVSAILFASILLQLRPKHMMVLQSLSFGLFFILNYYRIEDKINATIAVVVAVVANLFFYVRDIRGAHNKQRIIQMNVQLEKEQMDGAKHYLHRLQEAQTQTAIYHHDMRHALNLIDQWVRQGNLEKIQAFVTQSQENLALSTPVFFCEHETVNLILGSFAQRANEKDISFETEIKLPAQLPLADTELCDLLSNLLENALQGVEAVEEKSLRTLYIKAVVHEGKLVILVKNGFSGPVRMHNGCPVTQHCEGNHGRGVQSVIDIVERHQGLYVFETEGQTFQAKVLLHL